MVLGFVRLAPLHLQELRRMRYKRSRVVMTSKVIRVLTLSFEGVFTKSAFGSDFKKYF